MPKYAIEIASAGNNNHLWSPTRDKLRGRWNWSRDAHRGFSESARSFVSSTPVLPGECVMVDTDASKGVLFDLLAESPGGRKAWEMFSRIEKEAGHPFGGPWRLRERTEHPLNEDGLKEWLYQMRGLIDAGYAEQLPESAPIPKMSEIRAMPGKRRGDPWCDTPLEKPKAPEWVDAVPTNRELAEVGVGEASAAATRTPRTSKKPIGSDGAAGVDIPNS